MESITKIPTPKGLSFKFALPLRLHTSELYYMWKICMKTSPHLLRNPLHTAVAQRLSNSVTVMVTVYVVEICVGIFNHNHGYSPIAINIKENFIMYFNLVDGNEN